MSQKPNKTGMIQVKLPLGIVQLLKQEAVEEKTTLQWVIERTLEKHAERRETARRRKAPVQNLDAQARATECKEN
jgi:hypothetical protein